MQLLNLTTAALLAAAIANCQDPRFTVVDLGPSDNPFSQPSSVNNRGFVAGVSTVQSGAQHATLWYQGMSLDIGGLGGTNSIAGGINASGLVLGGAETTALDPDNENFCGYGTGLQCLSFLWKDGAFTTLPTLGGTNASWGGLNNRGEASGYAETDVRDPQCPAGPALNGTGPQVLDYEPVVWGPEPGQIRQLPLPPGDTVGVALFLNDAGQVVGMTGTCGTTAIPPFAAAAHAVLWNGDTVTDLGSLGGTFNPSVLAVGNAAFGINDIGQIVGVSALPGSQHGHAFLWTKQTGMQDLGALDGDVMSAALSINIRGEVIGNSISSPGPPTGNPRPFFWRKGKMYDLTTLVPTDSPLQILTAVSINSRGEIAGFGVTSQGEIHAYLALPSK